uniref:DUF4283 domain-containing protein n=1 Tax=Manihot esculenta TaxID=3983 RepID=A0A2C9VWP4_MANES
MDLIRVWKLMGGRKSSFKDILQGRRIADSVMWDLEDGSVDLSDDDSNCESEEPANNDCPTIRVFKSEKRLLRHPWQSTLIIKLLGHFIEFSYLQKRLPQMWVLKLPIDLIDLVNGFFIVIRDHYLTFW